MDSERLILHCRMEWNRTSGAHNGGKNIELYYLFLTTVFENIKAYYHLKVYPFEHLTVSELFFKKTKRKVCDLPVMNFVPYRSAKYN